MSLPRNLPKSLMETQWAQQLEPVVAFPPVQGVLLKQVSLVTGSNVINHKLGRNLQGWVITRLRASATLYDTQDTNQTPSLTLVLVSSANVVADIWVY